MVDSTMEIAKAAADIAKRRIQKDSEGGGNNNTSMASNNITSTQTSHQSSHQDTYSATPARVEYSPTHQPQPSNHPQQQTSNINANAIANESGSRSSYRPLPAPPNKQQQQRSGNNVQVKNNSSVVVINASSRHQQFAATHHPSLDIKVPSDASIHNNQVSNCHQTSNGSVLMSTKRGSLPALMVHRPSAGQVFSEAIGSFENAITSRVNNWLSTASGQIAGSRSGSVDMMTSNIAANLSNCKETLMDQIKKGIQLRKVPGSPVTDSPSPGHGD